MRPQPSPVTGLGGLDLLHQKLCPSLGCLPAWNALQSAEALRMPDTWPWMPFPLGGFYALHLPESSLSRISPMYYTTYCPYPAHQKR